MCAKVGQVVIQLLTVLAGILGGVAVGVQSPVANLIGQRVGGAASSVMVHATGTVFSLILLAIYRGENIQNWRALPWWTYFAGLFGVIVIVSINFTIPRIGTTAAISLIIVGQLIVGTMVDHYGWFGIQPRPIDTFRILGLLFLVAGSYLIIR